MEINTVQAEKNLFDKEIIINKIKILNEFELFLSDVPKGTRRDNVNYCNL